MLLAKASSYWVSKTGSRSLLVVSLFSPAQLSYLIWLLSFLLIEKPPMFFSIFQIHLLDLKSLQRTKTGHVIDLISNDVQRIEFVAKWALLATLSVVEFPMAMIVLLYFIGWEALMGVMLLLATIPVILILSDQCAKLRQQTAEMSDQRISLMNELVFGIRPLKANAKRSKENEGRKNFP